MPNELNNLSLPREFSKYGGKCPTYIRPLSGFTVAGEFEVLLPRTPDTSSREDVRNTYINGYHSTAPVYTDWLPSFDGNKPHCERDGSVRTSRDGYSGVEFVTPVLKGRGGIKYLCDVADILQDENCKVNSSCGLHLHVGLKGIVGNAKVDDVVAFLAQLNKMVLNFQDGLYAQTGTRRDRNQYCRRHDKDESLMRISKDVASKPKGSKDRRDFDRLWDFAERYRCVNIRNLSRGRNAPSATLEFRFPAGTLNKDKILMHLASIIFICRLSWKTRHTQADAVDWDLNKGYQKRADKAGVRTLRKLLEKLNDAKQGKYLKYESALFASHWDSMQVTALRMAKQYDRKVI